MKTKQFYFVPRLIALQLFLAVVFLSNSFCQSRIKKTPVKQAGKTDSVKLSSDTLKTELVSGTIYFSGANFPNVTRITINKDNQPLIQNCLARCSPGSIISYENVFYKDYKGILFGPVNKTSPLGPPLYKFKNVPQQAKQFSADSLF